MMHKAQKRLLYVVVFISGMTTLAVELAASRLLGAVYGTSNIVWANVIGLMLLYLSIGYFLGGRIADRRPYVVTLYRLLVWAAFLSALIPLIARPILQAAALAFSQLEAALAAGSFVSVLVLFSVPVTLLGMTSPFAIRLAVDDVSASGKVAGQLYAISTMGSLLGTFLPTLFLIPEWGTTLTFISFSALLYLIAMVGLWTNIRWRALRYGWMPLVIAALGLWVSQGALRAPLGQNSLLYEKESAYNYIQVQEDPQGYRYLYLNEGQGIHSQWHPTEVAYQRTWDFFLVAPYFNAGFRPSDMRSAAIIGLAAGTIARQHIAVYGDLPMDGIEIDPDIVEAAALYFDMNGTAMPSLRAIVGDGRYELSRLEGSYTMIGIDAYRPPYIPFHLTTVEFFHMVYDKLAADGVAVINVGRTNSDRRLVEALTHTMAQVFPSIHSMDVPRSFNTILVATKQTTEAAMLAQNLAMLPSDAPTILRDALANGVEALVPTQQNAILFTDDRAPVETVIDSLVLNFLFNDGVQSLR